MSGSVALEGPVAVDEDTGVVRCNHCGETIPMPAGHVAFVMGVLRGFSEAHAQCNVSLSNVRARTGEASLCRFVMQRGD